MKKITKEQIIKDLQQVAKKFKKEFPNSKDNITRDYYRSSGKYGTEVEKIFGTFKNASQEVFKDEKGISREDILIKKVESKIKKRYFISAVVPDQKINSQFMQSIETYCSKNNAKLILLLMRGVKKDATFSKEFYDKYSENIATEVIFNNNCEALDFKLLPQMNLSLTGLDEINNTKSLIIASTKQYLETIANRIEEFPHLLWSTGCINYPEYRDDRPGKIATKQHTIGGLVLEVVDSELFHIRPVECDDKNGFCDLGIYYKQQKVSLMKSDIVLGDVHCGVEDPIAIKVCIEMIKTLKCDKVYIHDLFDAASVNPHEEDNLLAQYLRVKHQQSLDNELQYLGRFLEDFTKTISNREFIVIPSNHNDFIDRWLKKGQFVFSGAFNAKLGAELFIHLLEKENPIQYYLHSRNFVKKLNLKFPKRNDKLNSYGIDIIHGDRGVGGAKGSIKSFTKCYGKNSSGHNHTPSKYKLSSRTGTNSQKDLLYVEGTISGWMATQDIIYENGTSQLVTIIDGKWRM